MTAKKAIVGTYYGDVPSHMGFDDELHELASPSGRQLQASEIIIHGSCLTTPAPDSVMFIYAVTQTIVLPANLPNSVFWTASFAETMTFGLFKQNDGGINEIGSFTFDGNAIANISFLQDVICEPGDKILIKSPIMSIGNLFATWSIKAKTAPEIIATPLRYFSYATTTDGLGIVITGFNADSFGIDGGKDVVIPSYINGLPVVEIGDSDIYIPEIEIPPIEDLLEELAEPETTNIINITTNAVYGQVPSDKRAVKTLFIPRTVTHVGSLYRGQQELWKIEFQYPSNVTTIGEQAFASCVSLNQIQIPSSVIDIGDRAFQQCGRLARVEIQDFNTQPVQPSHLTRIGSGAFFDCKQLATINFPDTLEIIERAAFAQTKLHTIVLPSRLKSIGKDAFSSRSFDAAEDSLYSVTINSPSELVNIDSGAFAGQQQLAGITLPNSLQELGDGAFAHCKNLANLVFQESSQLYKIGIGAFMGCENLHEVAIPASVSLLGAGVFSRCLELVSATLPSNITHIPDECFNKCALDLNTFQIPATVQSIGNRAFAYNNLGQSECILTLSPNIQKIDYSAFRGCNITELRLMQTSVELGSSVFAENPITKLHIEGDLLPIIENSNIADISGIFQNGATQEVNLISSLTLGDSITHIPTNLFANHQISEIIFPPQIFHIGEGAFYGNNLVELNVSAQRIEDRAFMGNKIANLSLEGVEFIGNSAFANNQISDLVITTGVQEIQAYAFTGNPLFYLTMTDGVTLNQRAFYQTEIQVIEGGSILGTAWGSGTFGIYDTYGWSNPSGQELYEVYSGQGVYVNAKFESGWRRQITQTTVECPPIVVRDYIPYSEWYGEFVSLISISGPDGTVQYTFGAIYALPSFDSDMHEHYEPKVLEYGQVYYLRLFLIPETQWSFYGLRPSVQFSVPWATTVSYRAPDPIPFTPLHDSVLDPFTPLHYGMLDITLDFTGEQYAPVFPPSELDFLQQPVTNATLSPPRGDFYNSDAYDVIIRWLGASTMKAKEKTVYTCQIDFIPKLRGTFTLDELPANYFSVPSDLPITGFSEYNHDGLRRIQVTFPQTDPESEPV